MSKLPKNVAACAVVFLASLNLGPAAIATPDTGANPIHPLASKEEMIRDRFQRFQDRVFRLREQLSQTEPENAARLGKALSESGELALADKLDQLIRMLQDSAALDQAVDAQGKWIEEADKVLSILLEQDSNNEERKQELERLQAYREKLAQILAQEKALRAETGQTSAAARFAQQLDQAIKRLSSLQARQQKLSQATSATPSQSSQQGTEQQELSRDTAQLAEDIARLSESSQSETKDAAAMEAAKAPMQAAAQSTQSGAQSMSQAGEQLGQSNPSGAQPQQQDAEKALAEAKKQLEAAKEALKQQRSPGQLGGEQKAVAQQTKGLSDQMKQDAAAQSQSGGKSGGKSGKSGQSGQKNPPGQKNLDQAEQEMNGAAESLEGDKPQEATPKQDNAIAELEQAQQELEQALEQLRKEQREETLRDLEARFREMLSKQRPINESTLALDQMGKGRFGRAEELQLADLSAAQRALAEQASTCLHILDEEGTTIAFPRVVEQLAEDMGSSAERLAALDVALITQTIQQEIIDTLEQLLEAVKKMQQENEQQAGQQSPSSDKEPPLLPPSAELKLLRASQMRVNTRTTAINESAGKGIESPQSAGQALRKLAARQVECAEIAKQMRDRPQ
jgi:hypothetical protein